MGKIELIRPGKLQPAHYLETSNDFPVKPYELVGLNWRLQGICGKTLAQEVWFPEEILIFSPRNYQLNSFVSRKPTMVKSLAFPDPPSIPFLQQVPTGRFNRVSLYIQPASERNVLKNTFLQRPF